MDRDHLEVTLRFFSDTEMTAAAAAKEAYPPSNEADGFNGFLQTWRRRVYWRQVDALVGAIPPLLSASANKNVIGRHAQFTLVGSNER